MESIFHHVEDDGHGIDLDNLRQRIVSRNMVSEKMAADLNEGELLEFLFLPGFSTREKVTEISGRGVGLDVVHSTVQQMRGKARRLKAEHGPENVFDFSLGKEGRNQD